MRKGWWEYWPVWAWSRQVKLWITGRAERSVVNYRQRTAEAEKKSCWYGGTISKLCVGLGYGLEDQGCLSVSLICQISYFTD